jgi:hypothetical protein
MVMLTVCIWVQDNETCINLGGLAIVLPVYGIGMASKTVSSLVEVNIVATVA